MTIRPAYQAALDYIFSFVDFSKTHAANLAPENFDLRRMRTLLALLDHPHEAVVSVHIAGTKGKGSTAALCAAALTAAGYRSGLYTSPHLQDFCERIQLNGEPIPQERLVALVERVRPAVAAVPGVSTFEIMTALAFLYFREARADINVLEVGLGGRLDATNVVTPLVSVITSISLDHVPILGRTVAEIAAEKGGIIKPGIPVVIAPQVEEVRVVLSRMAAEKQAPQIWIGQDIVYMPGEHSLAGQSLTVGYAGGQQDTLFLPLLGRHQLDNAATAWAALQILKDAGLEIPAEAVAQGFANVRWPGRFEILHAHPYIILDAAHNADSAEKLVQTLRTYFPGRKMTVVFGASADKAVEAFLRTLRPLVRRLVVTRSTHPRAADPDTLSSTAASLGLPAEAAETIEDALATALPAPGSDEILLVTGSVFVVGAVRDTWAKTGRRL